MLVDSVYDSEPEQAKWISACSFIYEVLANIDPSLKAPRLYFFMQNDITEGCAVPYSWTTLCTHKVQTLPVV